MKDIILVLHNIRSAHNVGSMFRTADGAGVSKVFLAGYTPAPIDRFGRAVKEIQKTALGAQELLPWESGDAATIIPMLRKEGYVIVALEQDERAIPIYTYKTPEKVALIVGNEVLGVPKEICDAVDDIVDIPMHGKKESLNVSVATGIALCALRNASS